MLWVIGGWEVLVAAVAVLGFPEHWVNGLALQMSHADWEGYHCLDLIFPLFIFVSGVTIPFSLAARQARGTSIAQLQWIIIRRSFVLILIGVSFSFFDNVDDPIRLYTVL